MGPENNSLTHAVLVHGIFNTGWVFRRMVRHLEDHGIRCHVITLKPCWGGPPIEELSAQLKQFIHDAVPEGDRFSLIGFSMGALVCRYYLQALGGYHRTRQFFSISAPHHGTIWSWVWIGRGTVQMRGNSEFLTRLNANQDMLSGMDLVSYWTPWDQVIIPPGSSVWSMAENVRVPVVTHQWMPNSLTVIGDILKRIKRGTPE
jgi:triacylglycerol lipase